MNRGMLLPHVDIGPLGLSNIETMAKEFGYAWR